MAKKADAYAAVASRLDKTLLAKVNQADRSREIKLDLLTPRANQPRRFFDEGELAALTESVTSHGIRNPLHVRRTADDKYEILAGERRYRAAKRAGLAHVPVILHEISNEEADTLAVLDNLHRSDLNPIEETEAILTLAQASLGTDRETTIAKIQAAANVSRGRMQDGIDETELTILSNVFSRSIGRLSVLSFSQTRLPLLNLPPVLYSAVLKGSLPYTAAMALRQVKDEAQLNSLLDEAIADKLTRAQILRRVKAANEAPVSLRNLEARVKSARGYLAVNHLKRIPTAKRADFTKLVESFVTQVDELLKDKNKK